MTDDVQPIITEAEYDAALAQVRRYFDNEPAAGTPEARRFDQLVAAIDTYEKTYYP